MNDSSNTPVGEIVCFGLGGLLVVGCIVWASIIGFYTRDLPMLLGGLAIGAVLLFIGSRMKSKRKQAEIAAADRRHGVQ